MCYANLYLIKYIIIYGIIYVKVYFISIFLIYIYVIISLAEWLSHYYLMHYNAFLKNVLQLFNCKIDNTTYFSNNEPKNECERWLKEHIRLDLRVIDDNILEYMDELSCEWKKLPTI